MRPKLRSLPEKFVSAKSVGGTEEEDGVARHFPAPARVKIRLREL